MHSGATGRDEQRARVLSSLDDGTSVRAAAVADMTSDELDVHIHALQRAKSLIDKIKSMKDFVERGRFVPGGEEEYMREVLMPASSSRQIRHLEARLAALPRDDAFSMAVPQRGYVFAVDVPAGSTRKVALDFAPLQVFWLHPVFMQAGCFPQLFPCHFRQWQSHRHAASAGHRPLGLGCSLQSTLRLWPRVHFIAAVVVPGSVLSSEHK